MSDKSIVGLTDGISSHLIKMFAVRAGVDNLGEKILSTRNRITNVHKPLNKILCIALIGSFIYAVITFGQYFNAIPDSPPNFSSKSTMAEYEESAKKVEEKYMPSVIGALCVLALSMFSVMYIGAWEDKARESLKLYSLLSQVWDVDEGKILAEMNASGSQKAIVDVVDKRLRSLATTVLDLESSSAMERELDDARWAFTKEYEVYTELGIINQRRKFYFSEGKS